jgi:hypothetical protein
VQEVSHSCLQFFVLDVYERYLYGRLRQSASVRVMSNTVIFSGHSRGVSECYTGAFD